MEKKAPTENHHSNKLMGSQLNISSKYVHFMRSTISKHFP